MKNKKAFEIQFNWIFVLIAGAAILIFFSSVIIKQKGITQSSTNIEMLKQMENIVSGAGVSTGTIVPLNIPNFDIKISCNKISVGYSSIQYQSMVLFAPLSIKGGRIITQTLAFNEPYRSANLLFITSVQAKYILIGDALMTEANKTLPSELDKEAFNIYDPSKIRNTNNYRAKLVFFNANVPSEVPSSLAKMQDSGVMAIKVTGRIEKGTVDFYKKSGNAFTLSESSAYLGKSSMIAAIYAENPEMYNCNMNNVFSRNRLVTQVYQGKARNLMANTARPDCRQVYSDSLPYLNRIESSSSRLSQAQRIDISDINDISSASISLESQNAEAQKLSCPMIY
ncbi:hypothetical protein HYX06_05855 [Candidatus Woesearchaeota archaeon]|nr:hypothetical protein [Candidatus Woesearchaeota archaeon]